jgi:hypothetical protein
MPASPAAQDAGEPFIIFVHFLAGHSFAGGPPLRLLERAAGALLCRVAAATTAHLCCFAINADATFWV